MPEIDEDTVKLIDALRSFCHGTGAAVALAHEEPANHKLDLLTILSKLRAHQHACAQWLEKYASYEPVTDDGGYGYRLKGSAS